MNPILRYLFPSLSVSIARLLLEAVLKLMVTKSLYFPPGVESRLSKSRLRSCAPLPRVIKSAISTLFTAYEAVASAFTSDGSERVTSFSFAASVSLTVRTISVSLTAAFVMNSPTVPKYFSGAASIAAFALGSTPSGTPIVIVGRSTSTVYERVGAEGFA